MPTKEGAIPPGRFPGNDGLRRLIQERRKGTPPLAADDVQRGFRGWHERGYLPHRDERGLLQFVTFHLADALPANVRAHWATQLAGETDPKRRRRLESLLDGGNGTCLLRQAAVAQKMEEALRYHDGRHYQLKSWVIMPNHVHVLVKVMERPLAEVVAGWKRFTAREINRMLGGRGRVWAPDHWDTYVRDSAHETRIVRYIEANPVKARLVRLAADWPWGSARASGPRLVPRRSREGEREG